MERYFAIIYPITCKQILTPTRLRVSIIFLFHFVLCISAPQMSIQKCYRIKLWAEIGEKIKSKNAQFEMYFMAH